MLSRASDVVQKLKMRGPTWSDATIFDNFCMPTALRSSQRSARVCQFEGTTGYDLQHARPGENLRQHQHGVFDCLVGSRCNSTGVSYRTLREWYGIRWPVPKHASTSDFKQILQIEHKCVFFMHCTNRTSVSLSRVPHGGVYRGGRVLYNCPLVKNTAQSRGGSACVSVSCSGLRTHCVWVFPHYAGC
jgi:hypothetical protein